MYQITFNPFVGNEYNSSNPKILVLGESHYEEEGEENKQEYTKYVVNEYAKRINGKTHKFFTIVAKIIAHKSDEWLDNVTAKQTWEKLAFYNYIQDFVGNKSRQRPTQEMFENSREAFKEIITRLKPEIVIVLGKQLGDHLKENTTFFNFDEKSPIFCYWYHPSTPRYFKIDDAKNKLDEALKLHLK